MSNAPLSDDDLPATGDPLPEEEPSWLERLLARFGLGEEPDLREVIEDALARGKEAGGHTFSAQERAMLRNILRFGKLTVEDVMDHMLGEEWRSRTIREEAGHGA